MCVNTLGKNAANTQSTAVFTVYSELVCRSRNGFQQYIQRFTPRTTTM